MKTDVLEMCGTAVWKPEFAEFPETGSIADQLKFLLHYAVLAPSSHNSQPWKFRISGENIDLYMDRTRACPVVDPNDRELIISCGAAFFNLRVAARHYGFLEKTELFPDRTQPDLLARFKLGPRTETYLHDAILFQCLRKRRTNRHPFQPEPIPEGVIELLQEGAREEGAWIQAITGDSVRAAVALLVTQGDRVQMSDPHFRSELARWLRSAHGSHHDGIPASSTGVSPILSLSTSITALALRTFDMGEGKAARDSDIIAYSPLLVVIGTANDVSQDWFAAGQALEKIWLRCALEDLSLSFLNQPIELPDLRVKLSALIHADGYPQLLLRIGSGPEVEPTTPRRSVHDVVT